MVFDRVLAIAENVFPELLPVMRKTRLFNFPRTAHEVLRKEHDADEAEFVNTTFFLPFQYVAVEDPASCVFLWDEVEGVQGLGKTRRFIDAQPLDDPVKAMEGWSDAGDIPPEERDRYVKWISEQPKGTTLLSMGTVQAQFCAGSKTSVNGIVSMFFLATPKGWVMKPQREPEERLRRATLRNVLTALEEIVYFNDPARYVVERSPVKAWDKWQRHGKRSGKIARSHERPVYTLLTPKEARAMMGVPDPTTQRHGPVPHERRRHFRTYKAERWTHAKGKTIVVPACWIGPHEGVKDGTRYKVMLDL